MLRRGDRGFGARGGKLHGAIRRLEAEAYAQLTVSEGSKPEPFTDPLFSEIGDQWRALKAWRMMPGEASGYSDQNPWLMRAFEALDRAENRAEVARMPGADNRPTESPEAFQARIKKAVEG